MLNGMFDHIYIVHDLHDMHNWIT